MKRPAQFVLSWRAALIAALAAFAHVPECVAAGDDFALFPPIPKTGSEATPWTNPIDESFTPFQFAPICAPGCCLFPIRSSIYGIGIGGILSPMELYGIGAAGGMFAGSHAGILVAGILTSDSGFGLALSLLSNQTRNYGIAAGALNMIRENHGIMIGIVNKNDDMLYPFMSEAADEPTESLLNLQIGLFNSCFRGIQFGLLNYNSKALAPWFPLLNFSVFP